jgi:hypothetical protein
MGRRPINIAPMSVKSRQQAYRNRLKAGVARASVYVTALRDIIDCTTIKDARSIAEAALNQTQEEHAR